MKRGGPVFLCELAVVSAEVCTGPALPTRDWFRAVAGQRLQANGLQRDPVIG
jgi:hypothetical protein